MVLKLSRNRNQRVVNCSYMLPVTNGVHPFLVIVEDLSGASISLNNDLETINNRSIQWLVSFNSQKTESMILSRKLTNSSSNILRQFNNNRLS